jgi:hypothetical protein
VPSSKLDIVSASGSASAGVALRNNGSGGSDYASYNLYNNNAAVLGQLFFTGTGYNIASLIGTNGLGFYSNGANGITIWSDTASIKFQTGSGAVTSGSQRMTIFSTGNVGIGTGNTDSGERLQVTGNVKVTGAISTPTLVSSANANNYINLTGGGGAYIDFRPNNVDIGRFGSTGLFLGGVTNPTAVIDLSASTTARASLRIRSGTAPTSPNDGDIWYDGTNIYMRVGATTKTFTLI